MSWTDDARKPGKEKLDEPKPAVLHKLDEYADGIFNCVCGKKYKTESGFENHIKES